MRLRKFEHMKTGEIYELRNDDARLKDPETGDWYQAVIYTHTDDAMNQMWYCRERSDFARKFREVN